MCRPRWAASATSARAAPDRLRSPHDREKGIGLELPAGLRRSHTDCIADYAAVDRNFVFEPGPRHIEGMNTHCLDRRIHRRHRSARPPASSRTRLDRPRGPPRPPACAADRRPRRSPVANGERGDAMNPEDISWLPRGASTSSSMPRTRPATATGRVSRSRCSRSAIAAARAPSSCDSRAESQRWMTSTPRAAATISLWFIASPRPIPRRRGRRSSSHAGGPRMDRAHRARVRAAARGLATDATRDAETVLFMRSTMGACSINVNPSHLQ